MGGEKIVRFLKVTFPSGSPPHGRGKDILTTFDAGKLRITPAWAGKRYLLPFLCSGSWDHPRMGGEKVI